jgi:hypothetical protein
LNNLRVHVVSGFMSYFLLNSWRYEVTPCKERQGKYRIFLAIRCTLLPSTSLDASSILVHLSAPQNAEVTFSLTLYVMQVGRLCQLLTHFLCFVQVLCFPHIHVRKACNFLRTLFLVCGPVTQSVYRLPTGWTARGSNPGWGEIFRTCPDQL